MNTTLAEELRALIAEALGDAERGRGVTSAWMRRAGAALGTPPVLAVVQPLSLPGARPAATLVFQGPAAPVVHQADPPDPNRPRCT